MRTFSSTDLAERTDEVLAAVSREHVEIMQDGAASFVIVGIEWYEAMTRRERVIEDFANHISIEGIDALHAALDTGKLFPDLGESRGDADSQDGD